MILVFGSHFMCYVLYMIILKPTILVLYNLNIFIIFLICKLIDQTVSIKEDSTFKFCIYSLSIKNSNTTTIKPSTFVGRDVVVMLTVTECFCCL